MSWTYRSLASADVPAGLEPLALERLGEWDPEDLEWEGLDLPAILQQIRAAGPRPEFRMETVLPFDDPAGDGTILSATDRFEEGDVAAAEDMLGALLAADVRCLDAHAHLGMFAFDHELERALSSYEAGVAIGERSLPEGFGGVLDWGWIENRPFLRCLHGLGLCRWRLRRWDDAARVFESMLWLNPGDNQGAGACLEEVLAREAWPP